MTAMNGYKMMAITTFSGSRLSRNYYYICYLIKGYLRLEWNVFVIIPSNVFVVFVVGLKKGAYMQIELMFSNVEKTRMAVH